MKIANRISYTNEDNMALMSRYPDGYFDIAIVDLEYCIGASKPSKKNSKIKQKNGGTLNVKQKNYKQKDWDLQMSPKEYFDELFRVSKKQIIWGGNYYGLKGGYLVWDKLNGESDQFGCELAWLSFSNRTDKVYYMWAGMMQGLECSQNIKKALIQNGNKSENVERIHPTQKPVLLYQWQLEKYCNPDFKILDTHHGSGSLSEAYLKMIDYWNIMGLNTENSELVACEIDQEYYEDSINRLNNYLAVNQSIFQ